MITVTYFKSHRGYERFTMEGHANFNPGQDIICAAASGLAWALVGVLDNIPELQKHINIQSGSLQVEIVPFFEDHKQQLLDMAFETVIIGLKQIEKKYPDFLNVL